MESLTPEEQKIISQAWHTFFRDAAEIDTQDAHPRGWSWFWGLYDLYADPYDLEEFDIATIQTKLPDDHWLKKIDDDDLKNICHTIHNNEVGEGEAFLNPVIGLLNALREVKNPYSAEMDFSNFNFDTYINFSNLIFLRKISFAHAKFSQDAIFDNAIFLDEVNFDNAIFSKDATFDKTLFYGKAFFTNAKFSEEIKFDSAEFFRHTNFMNTKFIKYVPSFHKAVIHSNTSWDMNIKHWPLLENSKDEEVAKIISGNQNTYENLASHMKNLDKYHDEHFFFRQEMRCRRVFENFFIRFPYAFYDVVSDYGYSIEKAFYWWALHILLGTAFIWGVTKNALCALPVSFANAHGFLPFHKGSLSGCYKLFLENDIFNIIWGFQTVFGILFLFLLLLTLRIRFRLK